MKIIFKIILFLIIISNKKPKIFKYHKLLISSFLYTIFFIFLLLLN